VTTRASTWSAACLGALALAGCASTPEEDPVQIKLNDVDTRLARIERVVANQSLLEMANQVAALSSDMRAIHNDIDELNHNLELSRKQTRDLYADLDQRLKNLESRGAPATGGAAASVPGSAAPSAPASPAAAAPETTDSASYQAAFQLLKDSQYDRAIAAFQKFLVSFPDSSLADNAQYWLGEAYYVNKSYSDALAAFKRVAEKYPQSRKLPDALLKVGYCDYELKQWQAANEVLTQVATTFPDTPAGHLAQQRLEKMAAEKH
jgi:tol-pal system protein YbgF